MICNNILEALGHTPLVRLNRMVTPDMETVLVKFAALKLAKRLGRGKMVVTVLPDTAERYFSTPLFKD